MTRANVIIKQLWNKKRGWVDPNLLHELLRSWNAWVEELMGATHEVHIFLDTSEQEYGAVAYPTTDQDGQTYLSLIIVRSRVTPTQAHIHSKTGTLRESSHSTVG